MTLRCHNKYTLIIYFYPLDFWFLCNFSPRTLEMTWPTSAGRRCPPPPAPSIHTERLLDNSPVLCDPGAAGWRLHTLPPTQKVRSLTHHEITFFIKCLKKINQKTFPLLCRGWQGWRAVPEGSAFPQKSKLNYCSLPVSGSINVFLGGI